ncbi:hypothetical protein CTAYLR_002848 [Chrysophaeum taylorii]|uniref:Uncharacterized protein n=1 Tax=Chrysophaeum taylorii TaxID=2483200 RepID=A0AAD7U852_9STRA|nr:hypothetical protein CTAYLR_002848 [Chrysophaeum taylorii]
MRLIIIVLVAVAASDEGGYVPTGHGVDWSFPMHHASPPFSPGAAAYGEFLEGCAKAFSMKSCKATEEQRMEMNREQAKRQRNYTSLGFGRIRAPEAAYAPARAFWEAFRERASVETWPPGNTYTNNWAAASKMVSLEDGRFQPLGLRTKRAIWDGLKPTLEAWTGAKLKATSLYGIRVYSEGAVLNPHLDRLPLVTSAIMQIDQDVDEPWPIEVVGHDGRAYNVTLTPGDVALYESHTIIHGRPYPLKGQFFANIFVHFIPLDPTDDSKNDPGVDFAWGREQSTESRRDYPAPPPAAVSLAAADRAARASPWLGFPSVKGDAPVPAPATLAADRAARREAASKAKIAGPPTRATEHKFFVPGEAHYAAKMGDLAGVLDQVKAHPAAVNAPDENLWTPLHEAARAGVVGVVEALVQAGADLGARTISGATALFIARQHNHHPIVHYLESIGAPEIADDEL